jgi:hypothetical protein
VRLKRCPHTKPKIHCEPFDRLRTDFDQNYTAINTGSGAEAGSAGVYTVRTGDSLQGVAYANWGDASLWYMIAEANGLSASSVLSAGQILTIPAKVSNFNNNAGTIKPYDAGRAIGDVQPGSPVPAATTAASKGRCGVFGQILLVVIAVAVTALTASAAAVFAGGILGASSSSAGAVILGGALAGAAGSVASQIVGTQTGIQQGGFSFKGVALAAIGGGVGAAIGQGAGALKGLGVISNANAVVSPAEKALGTIGKFLSSKTDFLAGAVRGALASGLNQGIAVATKLQSKFSWSGVAAAAVGGGVSAQLSGGLPGLEGKNANIANALAHLGSGGASALANAGTRSILDGSDFGDNIIAALPDVIGNTVGQLAVAGVRGIAASKAPQPAAAQEDRPFSVTARPLTNGPLGLIGVRSDNAVAAIAVAAKVNAPSNTIVTETDDNAIVVMGNRRRTAAQRAAGQSAADRLASQEAVRYDRNKAEAAQLAGRANVSQNQVNQARNYFDNGQKIYRGSDDPWSTHLAKYHQNPLVAETIAKTGSTDALGVETVGTSLLYELQNTPELYVNIMLTLGMSADSAAPAYKHIPGQVADYVSDRFMPMAVRIDAEVALPGLGLTGDRIPWLTMKSYGSSLFNMGYNSGTEARIQLANERRALAANNPAGPSRSQIIYRDAATFGRTWIRALSVASGWLGVAGTAVDTGLSLYNGEISANDLARNGFINLATRRLAGGIKLNAAKRGLAVEARGGAYVLKDFEGNVVRSGRSGDLTRRAADHRRDPLLKDYDFDPVYRTDIYAEQRGLEKILHDTYQPPLDKIRPISPTNPKRQIYIDAAQKYLGGK